MEKGKTVHFPGCLQFIRENKNKTLLYSFIIINGIANLFIVASRGRQYMK